jgi:ferredoxin
VGHLVGKDIYQKLGKKIDNLTVKAPWNDAFYSILKELYSTEEADVVVKMPYTFSNLERIQKITQYETVKLMKILESLCSKGLVIDLWICDEYHYMPSPIVIGIFEFTMMRVDNPVSQKGWAKLFHQYMQESIYEANFNNEQKVSFARVLPHEDALSEYVEILNYEKATELIKEADKYSIGLCSCRHKKLHLNEKECSTPLDTCSTLGWGADYMIRHNLAKEVTQIYMLEKIALSKEMGLVLTCDNVQKCITYICHCCSCCCNVLMGISRYGYTNTVVTSNYIAYVDKDRCTGCGKCAQSCPVSAIKMIDTDTKDAKTKKCAHIDESLCLGCGVCSLRCPSHANHLVRRKQRVIHPETTFERVILQSLERGTLQNIMFDDPNSVNHKVMRIILGAFFRLQPVEKALMSDALRSTFLGSIKKGVIMQGRGWMLRQNYRGGKRSKKRSFWHTG